MNSLAQTVQKNTLFALLSSATRLSANAVLFILAANFYGPIEFGQFTTAHTLAIIFTLVADFGFDFYLATEISRERNVASFLFPRMLGVKLALSILAAAAMCGYGYIQPFSSDARELIVVFSLYLLFSVLLSSLFALFKSHEELHHESRITFVINAALLVTLCILGAIHASIITVAVAFVASRVLGLLLALLVVPKFVTSLLPRWDMNWLKQSWHTISVFGVFFVFGNLYFLLDTPLLSFWKGDRAVGIYQSVYRLMALALVLPDITVSATLPSLSRLFVSDQMRWRQLGSSAGKVLYHAGLIVGFVLVVGSEQIVKILFGLSSYASAVPILQIFGVIIIVRYTVEVPALLLTTSMRQRTRTVLVIAATIVNLLLNIYAIPRYGIQGAAYVSLVTNVLVGIGYIVTVRDLFTIDWISAQRLVPLGLVILGAAAAILLPTPGVWMVVVGTLMVYIPLTWRIGYSTGERDVFLRTIRSIVRKETVLWIGRTGPKQ
jgi:O-antigen/teichoic acid export membrane protein